MELCPKRKKTFAVSVGPGHAAAIQGHVGSAPGHAAGLPLLNVGGRRRRFLRNDEKNALVQCHYSSSYVSQCVW